MLGTPIETIGCNSTATWRICDQKSDSFGANFTLTYKGEIYGKFSLPMPGEHSMRNAACAIAATAFYGISVEQQQQALPLFLPPKRRLEILGKWKGAVVIDDFAHHPTAIKATIHALQAQYPTSAIHAVFEPRTNTTTRAFFQEELASCFDGATSVTIGPINRPERYAIADRLNPQKLQNDLQTKGIATWCLPSELANDANWGSRIKSHLEELVQTSDVVVFLSNGNIGGLRELLQKELSAQ